MQFAIQDSNYLIKIDKIEEVVGLYLADGTVYRRKVVLEYFDIEGLNGGNLYADAYEFYDVFLSKVNSYLFEHHGDSDIPDKPTDTVELVEWIAENGLYLDGLEVKLKSDS